MEKLILVSSIKHKEKLNIDYKGKTYFGGNQSWFQDETMIFGGCGPVCAFNLFNYYGLENQLIIQGSNIVSQLVDMYHFIKPTEIHQYVPNFLLNKKLLPPTLGVRSISQFKLKLIHLADLKFPKRHLHIHEFRFTGSVDSGVKASTKFIELALKNNQPLCFLNTFHHSNLYVSNSLPLGKHPSVDYVEELLKLKTQQFLTHWVLVTGLYQSEISKEYYAECSTWGQVAYFKLSDFHIKQNWKTNLFHSGMLKIDL